MKQLPKDPTGTAEYCYISTGNQSYNLYANMEGNGNLTPAVNCGGSSGTPYDYRYRPRLTSLVFSINIGIKRSLDNQISHLL